MIKKINIRIIILIAFLMPAVMTWAESTVDELKLSDVELSPGGDNEQQYATLSVVSAVRKYAAFNVDVCLPEGVEPVLNNIDRPIVRKTGILPKDEDEQYYHTLSATYDPDKRKINIICFANPSVNFTAMTGALCRIALTASTYAKPGKISIRLTGQNLTTIGATKYEPEDAAYDITIGTTAKASLNVSSANKWSTCILPFAVAELPEGLKAYSCSSKSDEEQVFYLSTAESMSAYTPYVLYSESGYNGTLQGEVDASLYPEAGYVTSGYLTGAVKSQTTNEGYILQKLNGVVKFYKADAEKTYNIPAGKCWATPTDAEQDSYDFKFAPTAVNSVGETVESKNESKYNLSGIMIDAPRKGQLYIQNGKKYVK